jgi:competence protein ComFC
MEKLLNLIFVPECMFCGRIGELFCDNCISKCKYTNPNLCFVCHRPSKLGVTHADCLFPQTPVQFFYIYEYEGILRDCIRNSKYNRKEFMALNILCRRTFTKFKSLLTVYKDHIAVPIPLSKHKLEERQFNQAEMIARDLAQISGQKVIPGIVSRSKDTLAQHTANREERFKNMRNAFKVTRPEKVKDQKILLVDDICTTGATFLEAAKALYRAGAGEVRCFALSRKS